MTRERVVVAMSGGVDSSLSAALLKEAGYDVVGVMMRLWSEEADESRGHRACCSLEGSLDARRVCQLLDIPFYYRNFEELFQKRVVDYFCAEYAAGRTPNPCLLCNQDLKFDLLLKEALALGSRCLATGHYARVEEHGGEYRLLRGVDPAKDQSYFLYTVGQHELSHLLFPLGGMTKKQTRRMAAERRLPTAERAESQEICFIPDNDYRKFLSRFLPARPGDIVDTEGKALGRHSGIANFTVGQRSRLGLTSKQPLYVLNIDPAKNRIVVGSWDDLFSDRLIAGNLHFVSGHAPEKPLEVAVKVRYKSPEAEALLEPMGDRVEVRFKESQRAITPGQAVVFYQGEVVLGGGTIEEA